MLESLFETPLISSDLGEVEKLSEPESHHVECPGIPTAGIFSSVSRGVVVGFGYSMPPITSVKGVYAFDVVCLSVCKQDCTKPNKLISMKLGVRV